MLGLKKGVVKLVSHTEIWHQLFAEEANRLRETIGGYALEIEHIGSTSVCGIAAKPILDIAVPLEKASDGEKCVAPLENLGYRYRGAQGIIGRHYFVKGDPRTHHLHIVERESDFWRSHLLFRNRLRQNPQIAREYEDLKKELARKYEENRDEYQTGKIEFIERVLREADFVPALKL